MYYHDYLGVLGCFGVVGGNEKKMLQITTDECVEIREKKMSV